MPLEKVRKVLKIAKEPLSLETPIGEEDSHLGDFIEDKNAILPIDAAIQSNLLSTYGRNTKLKRRRLAFMLQKVPRPSAGKPKSLNTEPGQRLCLAFAQRPSLAESLVRQLLLDSY